MESLVFGPSFLIGRAFQNRVFALKEEVEEIVLAKTIAVSGQLAYLQSDISQAVLC